MAAVIPLHAPYGASPEDWTHFDLILGLGADLLPVVSNPHAVIAPESTLKEAGKTPSRYNAQRQVVGLAKWTERRTTADDIALWQRAADYGICLQTRLIRALDIDIADPGWAGAVERFIIARTGSLPKRWRSNSGKLLLAFELAGDYTKRRIKTEHGVIEFLATGQQFVAVGTHPSGVRYEWEGGLPDAFPVLAPDQFEGLWSALESELGVEEATEQRPSTKRQTLADAAARDPVGRYLLDSGRVLKSERDGRLHITCPWEHEHTTSSGESSTTYWPAHTGGYERGHFACLHAHCEHRTDEDFVGAVGYVPSDEFQAIAETGSTDPDAPTILETDGPKPARFTPQPAHLFAQGRPPRWLIRGVLLQAQLGVIYGESTAGKTFAALDLAFALSTGTPWRDRKVQAGLRIVYVCAEGAGGFRLRLKALAQAKGVALDDIRISVIADAPNMMEKADAVALAKAIVAAGGADLIIVDTWAQVTPGANENSGEDMGKALANCRGLYTATGAMVLLVHHAGKDTSKGARGWSGLRAAADVEIEVIRNGDARSIAVRKMKDGQGEGDEFAFRLTSVVVGFDEEGEEITSCALEHTTDKKGVKVSQHRAVGPLGGASLDTLRALAGATNEWVTTAALLAAVVEKMPAEKGRDTRKQRAKNSIGVLTEQGLVESGPLGIRLVGV